MDPNWLKIGLLFLPPNYWNLAPSLCQLILCMLYLPQVVLQRHPLHRIAQLVYYDDGLNKSNVVVKVGHVGKTTNSLFVFQCKNEVSKLSRTFSFTDSRLLAFSLRFLSNSTLYWGSPTRTSISLALVNFVRLHFQEQAQRICTNLMAIFDLVGAKKPS